VPAIDRSHDDQPGPTVRRRRSRLLVHAAVFAAAGVAILTLSPTSTNAAPTVQDGRFLQGGNLQVDYTCVGANQQTQTLLDAIMLSSFPLDVTVRSAAVEPSPSPGEDFEMEFTWDIILSTQLLGTAADLGVEQLQVGGNNTVSVVSGATGADSVGTDDSVVTVGDGSVPVAYTLGPFFATYNRTAAVDEPIVFAPGEITTAVVTLPAGTALSIVCSVDGEPTMVLNDETGVAPSTTTTTQPPIVPTTAAPTPTTTAVGGAGTDQLPRTGSSSNLLLALLGLALIDIGYLAVSASRTPRLGRTSSVS
jgi:LPXTG-motif cell wall-anchored protein